MVKALFDTNILIDYLNGISQAREELARYAEKSISIVTWMEVLVGAENGTEAATRRFLNGFELVQLNEEIAGRAVELRRRYRMRLPDAVIWASADVAAAILVTRNTKDFASDTPGIRVPYML